MTTQNQPLNRTQAARIVDLAQAVLDAERTYRQAWAWSIPDHDEITEAKAARETSQQALHDYVWKLAGVRSSTAPSESVPPVSTASESGATVTIYAQHCCCKGPDLLDERDVCRTCGTQWVAE